MHTPPKGRVLLLSSLNVVSSSVLVKGHPPDVCSLSGLAKLEPVSAPLQDGIRFFRHLNPAPPTVCLAVQLPLDKLRAEIRGFHVPHNNPMSDLGAPCTPAVLQFRVSTLETYILTAYYSHRGIAFDLLSLSRSVALDDACGHSINFTLSLVPSP